MSNFERLFSKFLLQRSESLDWSQVKGPSSEMVWLISVPQCPQ